MGQRHTALSFALIVIGQISSLMARLYKANHVASNNVHYGSMEPSGVPRRDLLNEVGRRIRRRIGIVVGRSPSS
jgi:hypothetical protein